MPDFDNTKALRDRTIDALGKGVEAIGPTGECLMKLAICIYFERTSSEDEPGMSEYRRKREWLRAQYRAAGIEAVFDTIEAEATALSYLSIAEAEEFKERHGVAHQHARANVLDVANEVSTPTAMKR